LGGTGSCKLKMVETPLFRRYAIPKEDKSGFGCRRAMLVPQIPQFRNSGLSEKRTFGIAGLFRWKLVIKRFKIAGPFQTIWRWSNVTASRKSIMAATIPEVHICQRVDIIIISGRLSVVRTFSNTWNSTFIFVTCIRTKLKSILHLI
jgi:hypothetical protein